MRKLEEIESFQLHGGQQHIYRHASQACCCDMVFALYLPPKANTQAVPLLWYLSGLTCTHENAMTKAHLQYHAAKHGIAIVYPDTSPRGDAVADDQAYDLGQGAGFYVNATQKPWQNNYKMYDYIVDELPALLVQFDNLDMSRQAITGHSMGGHGALTIAMNNQKLYSSLSAFAPICNPTASDWGRKQLTAYLGEDESTWQKHDASLLLADCGWKSDILIDQGCADSFLDLLCPQALSAAIAQKNQPATIRFHQGYDHSYFFVCSFVADHVQFHAQKLAN